MKLIVTAAFLLAMAGTANAQQNDQQSVGGSPAAAASSAAPAKVAPKPKGQIIMVSGPNDRKRVGSRAHCSNGTSYWNPEFEEGYDYCDGKDAPNPDAPPARP